jgi:hypothetical protein
MAAWKRAVVSVLGALGAGAAVAAWRERRRGRRLRTGDRREGVVASSPPAPARPPAPDPPAPPPAQDPPASPPRPAPGDDPGAAIDAARERLRREAAERRDAIDGPPAGEGGEGGESPSS